MKLFSKRYSKFQIRRFSRFSLSKERDDADLFLKESLRVRLQQEIKYVVNSNDYIDPFLVVIDEFNGRGDHRKETYLREEALKDISLRELGYDFSSVFSAKDFSFNGEEYSDTKLMDLIETLLIFSQTQKREELERRFQKIFDDEQDSFTLHGGMVIEKGLRGLESVVPLIKEKNLQEKINGYFSSRRSLERPNWEVLARASADVLQLLLSSPKRKKETKSYAEGLCLKVAEKWTIKEKRKTLAYLLSETIKNAKALSNEIANVRHTDRSTIPVDSPDFYKLIATKNIALAELIILSLPGEYISQSDLEEIKASYLNKYRVDKTQVWSTKRTREFNGDSEEIRPEDIPF